MVQKVMYSDIESNRTQGEGGAFLINDLKRAVNELIDSGSGGAAIPEPNIIETNGVDVFSLTLGDYSVNRTSVWNSLINKPPVNDIKAIIHVRHTTIGENTYEVFRVIKDVTNNEMWIQSRGEGPAIDSGWAKLVNGNNLGTAATRDVGTSAGNVMEVGAGGLLTGEVTNWNDFAMVVLNNGIRTELGIGSGGNLNNPYGIYDSAGRVHHFAFGNPSYLAGLFCDGDDGSEDIKLTFYSYGISSRRRFAIVSHSGNLRQTTGQETMYSMSQKAITDALDTKLSKTDNAVSATKLQTARNLTIGSTAKSFDGSANISWSLAEMGLGDAATKNVGTGSDEIPTNSLLGAIPKVINFTSATGTVEITDTLPSMAIGDRVLVRKLNATQGTVTVTCTGHTFTRSALGNITLNSDGDFWLLEKVSLTRLELVDGYETGVNAYGEYSRKANGTQQVSGTITSSSTWINTSTIRYNNNTTKNFPVSFVADPSLLITPFDGDLSGRSAWVTAVRASASGIVDFYLGAAATTTGTASMVYRYTATGRWYA